MQKNLIFILTLLLSLANLGNAQTEEELWKKFVLDPKEENVKQFIANYPKSTLLPEMSGILWGQCKANLNKKDCELYIQYFPTGEHVVEANLIRSHADDLENVVDGVTDAVEDIANIFMDDDEPLQDNESGEEPENQFGDDAEVVERAIMPAPGNAPPPKASAVNSTPVKRPGTKPGTTTNSEKPKSTTAKPAVAKPAARFGNVTVQHNYLRNKQKGLLIHLKFKVENMEGQTCAAVAYFLDETKQPIRDLNGKYKSKKGNVASVRKFRPKGDAVSYNDFKLFMPYSELHKKGKHKILYYVAVRSSKGTLSKSSARSFTLNWR
ncbi:MAG: hypothetical protein ABMA02_10325 [Saprospiraceae bacterium]